MSKKPLIKPFKRFSISIVEIDELGNPKARPEKLIFGANGNPELYAKAGQFVRKFSKDHIAEWRKKL